MVPEPKAGMLQACVAPDTVILLNPPHLLGCVRHGALRRGAARGGRLVCEKQGGAQKPLTGRPRRPKIRRWTGRRRARRPASRRPPTPDGRPRNRRAAKARRASWHQNRQRIALVAVRGLGARQPAPAAPTPPSGRFVAAQHRARSRVRARRSSPDGMLKGSKMSLGIPYATMMVAVPSTAGSRTVRAVPLTGAGSGARRALHSWLSPSGMGTLAPRADRAVGAEPLRPLIEDMLECLHCDM